MSIKEIAEKVGVSVSDVSRVLIIMRSTRCCVTEEKQHHRLWNALSVLVTGKLNIFDDVTVNHASSAFRKRSSCSKMASCISFGAELKNFLTE
ncbi:MAG: hypothetical protein ACI4SF_01755 [Oscillospiraceae bacterium]